MNFKNFLSRVEPVAVKTVDSILASFQKTVDDLNQVAQEQDQKRREYEQEVATFTAKAESAENESNRATAAAARIKALLG